jgi:hypothetical protein
MWIKITNKKDNFKNNYKSFSKDEFLNLVKSIADKYKIEDYPNIKFYNTLESIAHCSMIISKTKKFADWELGVRSEVLDGKTYTKLQIDTIIKHELAHYIANTRHNDDCDHDERWKEVVLELDCDPSPYLPITMVEANFTYSLSAKKDENNQYVLSCNKCEKVLHTGDDWGAFQLFALSISGLPLSWCDLESRTSCCNDYYDFYADVEYFLNDLKKEDQIPGFQKTLEKLLEDYK